jgi:hypothetical protein
MKRLISAAVVLAVATIAVSASAQDPSVKTELRPFFGMYIPTGDQRDLFDDATMFGLQGALEVKPAFHLLGSFAWVPGQAKYPGAQQDVQILQYDVGMEFNLIREMGESWLLKPFVGLGGGARTYLYEADALNDRTCTSGYGTIGTEFQLNRTAIRLEGRGNVFCFKSPLPNVDSKTRNDVGISLGVAYHFR